MICQLGNKFEQNIKESKVFRIQPGSTYIRKTTLISTPQLDQYDREKETKNTLNNVNLNHKENQNLKHTLSNKLNKLTTLNFFWRLSSYNYRKPFLNISFSSNLSWILESYRDRVFKCEAPLTKTLNNFNTMQATITKLVSEFS